MKNFGISGMLILVLAGVFSFHSLYAVLYQVNDKLNVFATSLNMREKPNAKAKVVIAIPYAAKVTVLGKTDESFESEGISGKWVKVSFGKKTGYIFDGYLSILPAPPKKCKSLEEYAESRFAKISERSDKILTPLQAEAGISHVFTRQYREAGYERTEGYEESWEILTLKNVSMEEAFLIGRLCGGQSADTYKNQSFVRGENKVLIQGNSPVTEELTIEKKENGDVMLKAYAGV